MSKEEQSRSGWQNTVDSPLELLLEALAQSTLYAPLLASAVRKRQFERRELQRKEDIAQAEFERQLAEIRSGKKVAGSLSSPKFEKPLHKLTDLSRYFDLPELTELQRKCLSLRFEYGWTQSQIARYLDKDRKTVDEHIQAGAKKLNADRFNEIARKRKAKGQPNEF